ncbi:MAG TPA: histidine kinase, partial [Puia sp.]|nr:histidine kinase [Puia sp.]
MDLGKSDSCAYYAKKTIQLSKSNSYPLARMDAYNILSKLYKSQKMMDSAVKYLELTSATKDSLFNQTKERAVQSLSFDQKLEEQEKQQTAEQRKQELKAEDERYLNRIRFYGIVAALIVFSVVGFILYRNNRQKQFADLRHKTTELEMQALRAQMNPHFIFNSLNSINRFILQNNRLQASEYLTKFSRLVRLILQNSQAAMITLESELESVKLYLILEALRFDYHFEYKISVYPDLDISALKVPPLIIQPYVENAVWHGLMHKEEKGKLDIELSQENDYLYFKITD